MIGWLIGNGLLVLVLSLMYVNLRKRVKAEGFVAPWVLTRFLTKEAPFAMVAINLVMLSVTAPTYLPVAFVPLLVPLTAFIVRQVKNYRKISAQASFIVFAEKLVAEAGKHDIALTKEDMDVQISPEMKVVYRIRATSHEQWERLMTVEKELALLAETAFPGEHCSVTIEKKTEEPNEKTA